MQGKSNTQKSINKIIYTDRGENHTTHTENAFDKTQISLCNG